MTHPSEPAITLLIDDEHALRLPIGAQISFSPDHWIDMQQLVCIATIASSEFERLTTWR